MTSELPGPWKRPSIYDVARHAGVSHMTVSRVLNDSKGIRPGTRERVEAAIAETGYRLSGTARSLATRRTMRIGAIVHTPSEFGPMSTLLALEHAARGWGFTVVAYSHAGSDQDFEEGIAQLDQQGIDALCVIAPTVQPPETLKELATRMPVVVLGNGTSDGMLHVDIDQREGTSAAVGHLLSLGHRSLLHLAGPLNTASALARQATVLEIIEQAGGRVRTVEGDWSSESGYRVGADPDHIGDASGVFVSNDQMALGLIRGLSTRGIRVPDDISVVGFDDMPGAAHFMPPLTTVHQDFGQLGEAVVAAIVRALGDAEPQSTNIAVNLVIRNSTAQFDGK